MMPPDHSANGYDAEEARKARDWLNSAPTEFLLCRYDHRFPRLLNRQGRLSRGVSSEPTTLAGSFQIRQRCPDCGTVKIFTYSKGGDLYEASRNYRYEWPPGYKWPKGAASHISVADCRSAAYERVDAGGQLIAAAERSAG